MNGDLFGDRMKDYESRETSRKFLPLTPVYAASTANASRRSRGEWIVRLMSA
jgi:hypothetical protein